MEYYTYILYSKSKDRYYVGYTSDLLRRLDQHNSGWSQSTKSGIPWRIEFSEKFDNKSDAIRREKEIKRWKSRKLIVDLIQSR
ncbi:MAG: GIY-YIG nuclease family protein [Candidatus Marinimicrobia bacterium]|nr:GIY-YIG nuclease family protein [Candidatus Neomarinimicrobiota bacterium]